MSNYKVAPYVIWAKCSTCEGYVCSYNKRGGMIVDPDGKEKAAIFEEKFHFFAIASKCGVDRESMRTEQPLIGDQVDDLVNM